MIYDLMLLIFLIATSPFWLWKILVIKKKQKDLLRKLGIRGYSCSIPKNKFVIWIHAVSVGETKSAQKLIEAIKQKKSDAYIVISSTTFTGHEEARKCLKADFFVYLPFDFSWAVKRALNTFNPKLVLFLETDLWFHFLKYSKKMGAKTALISGKMSEKSSHRFKMVSFFSKKLFSYFDVIGVQNEFYEKLFIEAQAVASQVQITGNLKWDNRPQFVDSQVKEEWKKRLGIENNQTIVLASTHENEEELLLNALHSMIKEKSNLKILVAPRHPERFKSVYQNLQKKGYPCSLFSEKPEHASQVIILDQMGILNIVYQLVDLAIVGGSFVDIGGHNILEPVFYETPVFFGPFMHAQKQMKQVVTYYEAGEEISLHNLHGKVEKFFQDSSYCNHFKKGCNNLITHLPQSLPKTLEVLDPFLRSKKATSTN